jgi:uncharacterized YigZ family protein
LLVVFTILNFQSSISVSDSYLALAAPGRAEIREKGSRLLAFAYSTGSPEDGAKAVEQLERRYQDATHVAFAWKIGTGDRVVTRMSDAGEPAGTAGRPIAMAIEAAGLTNVCVAVVRYFGGTKLGKGGLARAYRKASASALAAGGRREVIESIDIVIRCAPERSGAVRKLVRPPEISLVSEEFAETCLFRCAVFRSRLPALRDALDRGQLIYEILPRP